MVMDCKIAIPSLSRSEILVERTLKLILKYGIEPSNIYVFIIPSEYKEYRKAISDKNINIITGLKGIAEQRGFISEFFEEGEFILTLDDDIRKIEEGGTCGIYPCNNPFFMKCYISKNLKFVIGCMRWFINNRNIETSRQFKLLEDYEISLKYFVDYGKIFRLNHICVDHDFNGKLAGGLASVADRSYSEKKKEVDKFYKKYKDYCSINQRKLKTGDKIDIKFRKMRQVQLKEI